MIETRYMLGADEAQILRTWLLSAAEPRGEKHGLVTAYRPHGDDAWTPEHLTMRAALFRVEHDANGEEEGWSFVEVTHPQDCEGSEMEEQVSAQFHSRQAAEGFLSGYAPLFSWKTHDERFAREGIELVLQHASVGDNARHFFIIRAQEPDAHAAFIVESPVQLNPLRESHAWHLWRLASGDRRMKSRE